VNPGGGWPTTGTSPFLRWPLAISRLGTSASCIKCQARKECLSRVAVSNSVEGLLCQCNANFSLSLSISNLLLYDMFFYVTRPTVISFCSFVWCVICVSYLVFILCVTVLKFLLGLYCMLTSLTNKRSHTLTAGRLKVALQLISDTARGVQT